ncbi:MAG: DUF2268 domain-containing putative Zn-dependent protease [Alphaproteobacteria bacterium]|nr:DUF2268 domain-containing putative Zn-dependent protease [Alphaproteobacteria bacterium]
MLNKTRFQFLNDGGHFSEGLKAEIIHEAETAFARIHTLIPEKELTVSFHHAPDLTIPGEHIGGYCPDSLNVHIYLDTEYAGISNVLQHMMRKTLAHEYHHACRWGNPGYGETLGEEIVSEGLADIFSLEAFPGDAPPWCTALNVQQTKALLEKATPLLDRRDHNHADWFFGNGADCSHWGAYTLGYFLVSNYLGVHQEKTASSLVHTPAQDILKGSGVVKCHLDALQALGNKAPALK